MFFITINRGIIVDFTFKSFCMFCFPCCYFPAVIPLADYYIIAGVVYQAPDLGSVISSRVVRL